MSLSDPEKSSKHTEVTTVVTDAGLVERRSPNGSLLTVRHADDALLAQLGYKAEFRREFSVGYNCVSSKAVHTEAHRIVL